MVQKLPEGSLDLIPKSHSFMDKLQRLLNIFVKRAQAPLADVSSTNTISSAETTAFLDHAKMTSETAKAVHEWAKEQIGTQTVEQEQINIFTYSRDLMDSSLNFYNKAKEFIESTDVNKSVSNVDQLYNAMVANYNNLTAPGRLDDQWVSSNQQFELSQDMKQMQSSMQYMRKYIDKQKNVEANQINEPRLP